MHYSYSSVYEYWCLQLLSEAQDGVMMLQPLYEAFYDKTRPLPASEERREAYDNQLVWKTNIRAKLYWGPNSLEHRGFIRRISRETYRVTELGLVALKQWTRPPSWYQDPEEEMS